MKLRFFTIFTPRSFRSIFLPIFFIFHDFFFAFSLGFLLGFSHFRRFFYLSQFYSFFPLSKFFTISLNYLIYNNYPIFYIYIFFFNFSILPPPPLCSILPLILKTALDFSSTCRLQQLPPRLAVAIGKIEMQKRKNLPIPDGWALDADGNVTTDATKAFEAGKLLPLGGDEKTSSYKGYTLSLYLVFVSFLFFLLAVQFFCSCVCVCVCYFANIFNFSSSFSK